MEDATLRQNTLTSSTGLAPASSLLGLRLGPVRSLARRALLRKFESIVEGELHLSDGHEERVFGAGTARFPVRATVRVRQPSFWTRVAFGGSIGAAESYIDGEWTADDLTSVMRIFVRNRDALTGMERGLGGVLVPLQVAWHRLRDNTRRGSRRNIAAHYDLGNEFYATFLDPTMMYSAALFEREDSTLEEAQVAKLERLCLKLDLRSSDHLLEIGTGWGGLALHAAREYGCRVTTTTISREQHDLACRRVADAGLQDRVRVLFEDYRDLTGEYDKLVSVEMIEAVGHRWYDRFFGTCSRLLKPDGLMALQAIVIDDRHYDEAVHGVDFIQRHVFPGSTIPSVGAITSCVARVTDLHLVHHEDLTPHYARTLALWRERFLANLDRCRELGFDDRFTRLWEYYLCYCEGGFAERQIGSVQMLYAKPRNRREPVLGALDRPA
ncbi:MAG: class I SAM-dependent methyltransferase [Planctomycetes bacterium]|nr:class I SAM-dependent methyltransferase [Planctomycetota bacterium]